MTDGASKQQRRNRTIGTFAIARGANANAVPKVVSAGTLSDSYSCLKCSFMNSVLRPELMLRPNVAAPPVFATCEVVVFSNCDAHWCLTSKLSGTRPRCPNRSYFILNHRCSLTPPKLRRVSAPTPVRSAPSGYRLARYRTVNNATKATTD